MKIEKVKIGQIKSNTKNPRIIKDDKFKKLVQSIKDFPAMLEIRPIVVNEEMIVLGGNMRLKACLEAGLKDVFIIKANELTPEQQNEFVIKDNVGFGEWDWDMLANVWEVEKLDEWALDTWKINNTFTGPTEAEDIVTNNDTYKDTDGFAMDYLNGDMKKFEIYVDQIDYETVIQKLKSIKESKGFKNNSEAVVALILNS